VENKAREKRILFIDPVGEKPEVQNEISEYLNRYKLEGYAKIDVGHLGKAPHVLEYYLYLSLIGPALLKRVKQAELEGYDAAIIGCFCDPALDAAKEICDKMVVVGVMEAAVNIASFLAPRFSIIAALQKSVQDFRDNMHKYGLNGRLASFRCLDLSAGDLMADPNATEKLMRREIRKAIEEDGAEAILLGCTLQLGHFQELGREFGVPVIDAVLAGLRTAEHLISIRDSCGWYTSKRCSFKTPPKGELASWGLEDFYNLNGMF
jgi:allantoin racemase